MEFLYLFRALLRRKWIILICVVVSSLIAFILTRNVKKSYRSTAQLSTRFTVSDQPNGAVNYIQSEFKFGNVIENITSPNVAIRHRMAMLTEDRKETGCLLILDVQENMQIAVLQQDFVNNGFPAGLPGLGDHGFGRHFGDDDGTDDDGSGDTTATTAPATTAGN